MSTNSGKVVTRIAPSPTGFFHVGTARSALFNYLFAKKHGGMFILRIEDTDTARSKKEFENDIIEGLTWLGLKHDAFYRQSERTEIYFPYIQKLIDTGHAFLSKEPQKDNPEVQVEVVRLKNLNKEITFTDLIRGDITFDTTELGDFVIARSMTEPLFHLTVVVDDHEMNVSHIIRGEDHISNTPRQILIQEALGIQRPEYAHIPLILASDRSKLSKRNDATSIADFREDYLSVAFINYLALLGWNPGDNQELFTLDELVLKFNINKVHKSGAVFNVEKLNSFNHTYIQGLSQKDFEHYVLPRIPEHIKGLKGYNDETLKKVIPELKERIKTLSEITTVLQDLDFYFERPQLQKNKLLQEGGGDTTKVHLTKIITSLEEIEVADFTSDNVKKSLWDYATLKGRAEVLWPMRFALTGKDKSPNPFNIVEVLGKNESIERLRGALTTL